MDTYYRSSDLQYAITFIYALYLLLRTPRARIRLARVLSFLLSRFSIRLRYDAHLIPLVLVLSLLTPVRSLR